MFILRNAICTYVINVSFMCAVVAGLDCDQVTFVHLKTAESIIPVFKVLIDDVLKLSLDLALCIEESFIHDGRLDFRQENSVALGEMDCHSCLVKICTQDACISFIEEPPSVNMGFGSSRLREKPVAGCEHRGFVASG